MDHNLRSLYIDVLIHGLSIKVHSKYKDMVMIVGWRKDGSCSSVKYYTLTQDPQLIDESSWGFFQNQEYKFSIAEKRK